MRFVLRIRGIVSVNESSWVVSRKRVTCNAGMVIGRWVTRACSIIDYRSLICMVRAMVSFGFKTGQP